MRIGSLFSGIGGLELGLEWSGLGHVVWQVESDSFCRQILARHWPDVQRYEDVAQVGSEKLAQVDLICGGFPCQDVSSAGKGAGLAGSRSGLWFEFARIVSEIRPTWVVVENVSSGAKRWVDQVVAGLEQLGYQTLPVPLSAQDVCAPHLRRRIFVVAYADHGTEHVESVDAEMASASEVADADGSRFPRSERTWSTRRQVFADGAWSEDSMPEPALCRVADGPAAWMDRNARLKALGNAVVPQCAEVVGYLIQELCIARACSTLAG